MPSASRKPPGLTFKKNLVYFLITLQSCFPMAPACRVGWGQQFCPPAHYRVKPRAGKILFVFGYLLKMGHKGKLSPTSPPWPPYFPEVTAVRQSCSPPSSRRNGVAHTNAQAPVRGKGSESRGELLVFVPFRQWGRLPPFISSCIWHALAMARQGPGNTVCRSGEEWSLGRRTLKSTLLLGLPHSLLD